MLCAHKQPCHGCKSSDILLHIMKPRGVEQPSALQGCLHPHPCPLPHAHAHPLHWLHICWLLLLLDWLLGSFLPFHFIVLLWTYPGGSHLAGLKASAALGPLGCPSSVYSAVKFAVSPTPSLTAKPVTSTCESEGVRAFGVIYKHIPEADKTSAGPQKDCCGVR